MNADEHPNNYPGWEVDARDGVIRLTHVECDTTYPWDGPIPLDELHGTVAEHLRLSHGDDHDLWGVR